MGGSDPTVFSIFLVFTGAALAATLALYARQSMLVSYILLGVVLGPWGFDVVGDVAFIADVSHVGVIFLLFLLGLNLHPQQLLRQAGPATLVTGVSALLFAAASALVAWLFGMRGAELVVVAAAGVFSSTIIGLKLLPTTALHHQHTGEVMISVLLLQDLIAIAVLLYLQNAGAGPWGELLVSVLALPALALGAWAAARYLIFPLFSRFATIQEYLFLVTVGWCLGVSEAGAVMGLSHEMGAFIGGVAIATSPVSTFIAESLKPLRDFFLVMFFFALGATFDLSMVDALVLPALLLAGVWLALKPPVFRLLFRRTGEAPGLSRELGVRLGQGSEFSLFIAALALQQGVIGERTGYVIQLATLLTFVVSSYAIMLGYPTPIAVSDRLRRD